MNTQKIGLLVVILLAVVAFYFFELEQYLTLDYFLEQKQRIASYIQQHFALSALFYFLLYTLVFALALPVGAILTLVGGALFGLGWGTVLVSFASTLGSTLALLAARFLLRDWVNCKFGQRMEPLNRGIARDGAFYLFTLRLVPLFPPALINLALGLTSIRVWTFYWVSQLGMLAGTAVYINAGTELGKLQPGQAIVTPGLIIAFVLLGIFPLLARWLLNRLRRRQVYARFKRPRQFDNNLVVIGAGSGGLVTAYIAAQVKAKVTLIEKHKMGGDCLNTGCVPSKALLRSAKIAHYVGRADEYGIQVDLAEVDFAAVMQRVQQAIKQIEPHDSIERYTELGVNCIQGEARLLSPYHIQVDDRTITSQNIVIATGGKPKMLELAGVENVPAYNSDTIWTLQQQPRHLLVVGGGPIGCELAQAFARLGSQVTILTHGDQILPREDSEASELVRQQFGREGIKVLCSHQPQRFESSGDSHQLIALIDGESLRVDFSHLLVAVGRKANSEQLGLEALDIEVAGDGAIRVDEWMRTRYPNIYAVGDVAGSFQFTHTASHQAWYAAVNALFGCFRSFKVDYSVIPWATFTDPEVARVGLNETEAKAKDIEYEVTRYALGDLDRAIVDGEAQGFVKVITPKGSDKVLGATIVGYHAGELINEFIATMKRGGRLNDILSTIHIYPTLGEANKFAAGEWKKAHKPERLLALAEKYHRWSRS